MTNEQAQQWTREELVAAGWSYQGNTQGGCYVSPRMPDSARPTAFHWYKDYAEHWGKPTDGEARIDATEWSMIQGIERPANGR